ncbi:hypothetical protein W97_07393 [Coniosporium apollinis CBS 100218]|uniref:Uncharacterized protein n=1 Tax=Coniosporium apollinis (strain CBS 100218) TaxID=1168221 RepID=R7Z1T9_CONA1|nr:uncharacterized protein W97_07393 [Coniosporium apollinis CBS 100218]EON67896.1 hypothetical protein W97_07393 [Coniosporium apollinis CBS 100218]
MNAQEKAFFNSPKFKKYGFIVNENATTVSEFHRLAASRKWKVGGKLWRKQWRKCYKIDYQTAKPAAGNQPQRSSSGQSVHQQARPQHSLQKPPQNHQAKLEDGVKLGYFESFPDFVPDPTDSLASEFKRLAIHKKWAINSAEYPTKLENFQRLCVEVGIDPPPPSITQCKKALKGVLVNLVNLVDSRRTGEPIKQFDTFKEFRRYTFNGRVFPKNEAKEDTFLKVLLRGFRRSGGS